MRRNMPSSGSIILWAFVVVLSMAAIVPHLCFTDYLLWLQAYDKPIRDSTSLNPILAAGSLAPTRRTMPKNDTHSGTSIDIAMQAQLDHGYPLQPVSDVLPRRLFVIYGLESSGTTFTARTIAMALGISTKKQGDFKESEDGKDHVQHISLPWGAVKRGEWGFETQYTQPLPMVPVFYPKPCQMNPHRKRSPVVGSENPQRRGFQLLPPPLPPQFQPPPLVCREFMDDKVMTRPHRFFVNMTTHITWYRERGVLVYPIIVVRDPLMHFPGILDRRQGHTPNDRAAIGQYEIGRAIIVETIEKGLNPFIVSYETMLTLQKPYLRQLYKTLGIETNYVPPYRNGNTKYLRRGIDLDKEFEYVELELMKEDGSKPRNIPAGLRVNNARFQQKKGVTFRAGERAHSHNSQIAIRPPPRASQPNVAGARQYVYRTRPRGVEPRGIPVVRPKTIGEVPAAEST